MTIRATNKGPRATTLSALRLLAVLTVATLGLAACDKDPVKPPLPKPFVYLAPTYPTFVLQNLVDSYNNRDSIQTAAVYDTLYKGYSPDAPLPGYFTREDEIHHVHRLHDDPNIVNVTLDFGPFASWGIGLPEVGDPLGTVVILIQRVSITINDVSRSIYSIQNVTMEFAFKPTVSAPGDTTWTVIRWREIAN